MGSSATVNIDFFVILSSLLFVSFSTYYGNADAQIFVFFIIVVAAAEATVGLSILILAYRHLRSIDVSIFNKLKG